MAARLTAYLVVAIVGVTLIAGLIVGAQRDDAGPVDLIVHNGVVFTGESGARAPMPEAVAVRANQILKVGSDREILRMQRRQTVTIDARGGAVLPGFNDAHLHLVKGGLTLAGADLAEVTSTAEAIARVSAWAAANRGAAWVVGHGWPDDLVESSDKPSRQALDAVISDRPVQLLSRDGETLWVNTRALRLARISARSAEGFEGRLWREPASYEGDGLLRGAARRAVASLLPSPTDEQRSQALLVAIAEAHRHGITSVQDADGEPRDFERLDAARKAGAVDMRVYSALPVHSGRAEPDVAALDDLLNRYPEDSLFKAGAAKIAGDGLDRDALNRFVRLLDARGWQVMIEAASPAEVEAARTAFQHAERSNAGAIRERRHRIEDQHTGLTRVGSKLALGSDWPYGPLSPVRVLQSALSRFTLVQALQAYTVNGAYASYDEQRKGLITPGMLADLVVLTDDIFSLPAGKLERAKVAYTIFDGRVVYPKPASRTLTN